MHTFCIHLLIPTDNCMKEFREGITSTYDNLIFYGNYIQLLRDSSMNEDIVEQRVR